MSRPRLSIRRKLLGLLVLFSLCPLILLAYLDHRAFDRFGALLAEEWGESLGAQARRSLAEQADARARLVEHALDQLASGLKLQARTVARELETSPPTTPFSPTPSPEVAIGFAGTDRGAEQVRLAAQLQALAVDLAALRGAQALEGIRQSVALDAGVNARYPAGPPFPRVAAQTPAAVNDAAVRLDIVADDAGTWLVMTGLLAWNDKPTAGTTALAAPIAGLREWSRAGGADTPLDHFLLIRAGANGIEIRAHLGAPPAPEVAAALTTDASPQLAALRRELQAGESGQRLLLVAGRQLFCIYRPLREQSGHLLWLVPADTATGTARAAATYALDSARRQGDSVLPLILSAGVVVALVAAYAARSVTQPVSQLKRVMEAVAGGDFSARVGIETGDELEELGHTFNQMIPQLAEEARLQQSMVLAREVQQRMLPAAPPVFPGVELAGITRYCEQTGGDYFDYLDGRPQGRQTLGVVIGDVAGHGTPAALLMTTARALLHGLLAAGATPVMILQQLNHQIAADIRPGHFMTLFYLLLDLERRQISWASAGHEPAFWWHAASGAVTRLSGDDIPLGVDATWQFAGLAEANFEPGDVLLLVTDGVCETRDAVGAAFGRDRLGDLLKVCGATSAETIATTVLGALDSFAGAAPTRDDLSIVVARISG